jgi:hypothetical protein
MTRIRHNLQASDLDTSVVVLGGVVGAGDQGALHRKRHNNTLTLEHDPPMIGQGESKYKHKHPASLAVRAHIDKKQAIKHTWA